MIKITDLYTATYNLLNVKYPTYYTYGHEVTEGFERPSFFVDLIFKSNTNDSVNFKKKLFTIMITYFPEVPDEIDNLTKADEIINLFGYYITVGTRKILVQESSYDFVGESSNILQVSIEIEYFENTERPETHVTAKEMLLDEKVR